MTWHTLIFPYTLRIPFKWNSNVHVFTGNDYNGSLVTGTSPQLWHNTYNYAECRKSIIQTFQYYSVRVKMDPAEHHIPIYLENILTAIWQIKTHNIITLFEMSMIPNQSQFTKNLENSFLLVIFWYLNWLSFNILLFVKIM